MLSLCLVIQRCLRGTPSGFCLRIIVNEKPLNLEKTTSIVLSVLLNNLCLRLSLIKNYNKIRLYTGLHTKNETSGTTVWNYTKLIRSLYVHTLNKLLKTRYSRRMILFNLKIVKFIKSSFSSMGNPVTNSDFLWALKLFISGSWYCLGPGTRYTWILKLSGPWNSINLIPVIVLSLELDIPDSRYCKHSGTVHTWFLIF